MSISLLYHLHLTSFYPTFLAICNFDFFPFLHGVIRNSNLGSFMENEQIGSIRRRCTLDTNSRRYMIKQATAVCAQPPTLIRLTKERYHVTKNISEAGLILPTLLVRAIPR